MLDEVALPADFNHDMLAHCDNRRGTAAAVCAPHLLLHDGDASRVDIEIHENDQNAVPRVEVFDNGRGMTRFELTERLGLVGVRSQSRKKILDVSASVERRSFALGLTVDGGQ